MPPRSAPYGIRGLAPDTPRRPAWHLAALILLAALVLRAGLWGDPLPSDDEQFYLLVGDRMWHGALPYIDIFDRKPFGLLALFAGMRALGGIGGGEGVLASQVIATLFAGLTALAIAAVAAPRTGRGPAAMAGLFYLAMLEPMAGGGTQAPVFFNLLTALAGLLALRTAPALDARGDVARAVGAVLLCGLAIQIKTNAALEGIAIGGWLAWRVARHRPPVQVAGIALGLAAVGLLLTVATAAGYVLAGHGGAWWFANVQSQFAKTGGFDAESLGRLGETLRQTAPLLFAGVAGLWFTPAGERRVLLAAWLAMALVEAFSIGNFWTFYLLPALVAASIAAAELFARPHWGKWAFVLLALPPALLTLGTSWIGAARARDTAARVMAAIPADVSSTCLLAYDAPVAILQYSHACLVTPYVFVDELRSAAEAHALPVDATVALRAALARRPGTIVTVAHSHWRNRNRTNDALLAQALRQGYRRIAAVPRRLWANDREVVLVWRRSDLYVSTVRRV